MTWNEAYFYQLMLRTGLTEEFDAALDRMLEQENPLSDLALSLCACGGDRNRQIHALSEYLLDADPREIQSNIVFSLVTDSLKRLYETQPEQLRQITKYMYRLAAATDWWMDDPWYTMYMMEDYYDEMLDGCITKENFFRCYHQLLYHGVVSQL